MIESKKGTRVRARDKFNRFVSSKHSAEMTIGTIIIIVLALVVLVILIFGFSTGWSALWDKIKSMFFPGGSNVQTIVDACMISCTTNSQYDYCTRPRDINFGKDSTEGPKQDGKAKLTCKELESKGTGISCESISCPAVAPETPAVTAKKCTETELVSGKKGIWVATVAPAPSAVCLADTQDKTSDVSDKTDAANANKKCCVPTK